MQLQREGIVHQLPKRPRGSYVERFKPLKICTNHYHVEVQNFQQIHIFSIVFNPTIPFDNITLRRQLLQQGNSKIRLMIENPVISGNNIYTTKPIIQQQFEIQIKQYRIVIKKVKTIKAKQNPKLLLSFLNNGLRSMMRKLNYIQIGKSGKYFNGSQKTMIDNLMMFNGYKSNFVLLENGFYLRVDSAKKIVRNQTVLQAIDEIYKMHQDKERDEKRNILQNQLTGKIIMTNYGKTSYHRIQEVVFQDLQNIQLDESNISLKDYYSKKYNITIKNNKQPLLKVESKRRGKQELQIYLIPELCLMTGIPQNFDQFRRKKISEMTIKSAEEKQKQITKLMSQLRDNDQFRNLKDMGIRIDKRLSTIEGKIIPMPRINLGQNNSIQQGKQSFFNLYNKPIYASKHKIRCGIIYFAGQQTRPLIDTFQSTSRNLHVKFQICKINAGDFDYKKAISMIQSSVRKASDKQDCNICLIILPNQLKTQYKKIKSMSLVNNKIICQITTQGTLKKKNVQSIATKILLQIIAKRGNTLWVPQLPKGLPDTMMIAFDTAKAGKTTLGMCATQNSTFSSIFSRRETFEKLQQKFGLMSNLTLQSIKAYFERNKSMPTQIVILHNSTSGDQISLFHQFFINPLKKAVLQIQPDSCPSFTMVMVNVKTSERFFTEGNGVRNAPAGTIVSTDIVTNYYDFYVVSQTSNRGAIVPNHYKVIYSDSKIQQGVLQQLIFSQCFNYVNWTGSIKIPGILQYAQKCAKFNSEILENEQLCQQLQNKLYFV